MYYCLSTTALAHSMESIVLTAAIGFGVLWLWSGRFGFLSKIPGPPSPSWIYGMCQLQYWHFFFDFLQGNMRELVLAENYGDYEFKWQEKYGMVYKVRGCFGVCHLLFFSKFNFLMSQWVERPPHGLGPSGFEIHPQWYCHFCKVGSATTCCTRADWGENDVLCSWQVSLKLSILLTNPRYRSRSPSLAKHHEPCVFGNIHPCASTYIQESCASRKHLLDLWPRLSIIHLW